MIKVQVDKLESDLATSNAAIGDFEPCSESFMSDSVNSLSEMNSDFISKVKDTLDAMTDTKAPELLKKIKEYQESGVALVKTFRDTDEAIAQNEEIK